MDFIANGTYNLLLNKAKDRSLVLPNFQRNYVWKVEQQKQLLASFLVNIPIGSFLVLEGKRKDFNSRPVCYKNNINNGNLEDEILFLLDGQQRLSTLFNIFYNNFKNNNNWNIELFDNLKYRWYLNFNFEIIQKAFGLEKLKFENDLLMIEPNEIIDGIESLKITNQNKDNILHPNYDFGNSTDTTKSRKIGNIYGADKKIPLYDFLDDKTVFRTALKVIAEEQMNLIKEDIKVNNNISKYFDVKEDFDDETLNIELENLRDKWIDNITDYLNELFNCNIHIPLIPSNQLARATSIFENMNKGGTPLNTFDIMIAKFHNIRNGQSLLEELTNTINFEINISDSLSGLESEELYSPKQCNLYNKDGIANEVKEFYLNLLSMFSNDQISIETFKKEKILKLDQESVSNVIDSVNKSFVRTLAFIQFRLGIEKFSLFPYKLFLLPIAKILEHDDNFNNKFVISKIEYWYWISLFSGRFREKQNFRVIEEISFLEKFISSVKNDDFLLALRNRRDNVFKESNYSDIDTLLLRNEDRKVPKAIHNGILQLLLRLGKKDLLSGHDGKKIELMPWRLFNNIELEDHHIIPLHSASNIKESAEKLRKDKTNILNSPLNRLYISKESNRAIGSKSLQQYKEFIKDDVKAAYFISDLESNDTYEIKLEKRYYKLIEEHFMNYFNSLYSE